MAVEYIALSGPFCEWLSNKTQSLDSLASAILKVCDSEILRKSVHVFDTLRAASSGDGRYLVIWNTDYYDATGGQSWAFISMDLDSGITRLPDIQADVLHRALKVAILRLGRLVLPHHYRLRLPAPNVKTCTAGGPDTVSHYSLAFWEGDCQVDNTKRFAMVIVGPDDGPSSNVVSSSQSKIVSYAIKRQNLLPEMIRATEKAIVTAGSRASCELEAFREFAETSLVGKNSAISSASPIEVAPPLPEIGNSARYETSIFTFEQWMEPNSPLADEQKQILKSNVFSRQPIRITGPAGSGKTLLMQLLCIGRLKTAAQEGKICKCLYICHNTSMKKSLGERFEVLGAESFMMGGKQSLEIDTLSDYCIRTLNLQGQDVVDSDAAETKALQYQIIEDALHQRLPEISVRPENAPLLHLLKTSPGLQRIFIELVVNEVGVAIKAHSLERDRKRYVSSEIPFSRLHQHITPDERMFVFDLFEDYYNQVTEDQGMLDSDDLAISLLSKLRTPIWNIRRKTDGVDFLFVDEVQLFNENERRLFAYLPKPMTDRQHLPIALALDEAQELKGAVSSGFGLLGIEQIANEHLRNVYRCTPSILKLAFFVIQHTTDLFGVDFPDFTASARSLVSDSHPLAKPPVLRKGGTAGKGGLGNYIAKRAASLRASNLRSVCVVVHADKYWDDAEAALLRVTGKSPYVLKRRGDIFGVDRPGIVMARAEHVGGQEFDAVISVGLEEGVVPPRISQESFAESLRQRALREMYLVFTRARYRLEIIISVNATVTNILEPACKTGLLQFNELPK